MNRNPNILIMKHYLYTFLAIAMIVSCGKKGASENASSPDIQITDTKETNLTVPEQPIALSDEENDMLSRFNDFGFDVMRKNEENYLFSPLSLASLLGMLAQGGAGLTREEICRVLRFEDASSYMDINALCKKMRILTSPSDKTAFQMANAAVCAEWIDFKESYTQTVTEYYDALLTSMDFSQAEQVCAYINEWADEKTHGLIPEVLRPEQIKSSIAVFLNALYFKSAWKSPFPKDLTRDETFTNQLGNTTTVPMMHQKNEYLFAALEDFQLLEMDYDGTFAMDVLLPSNGKTTSDLIAVLSDEKLTNWRSSMTSRPVDCKLPAFSTDIQTYVLREDLQDLGMKAAFSDADFSNLSSADLFITTIFQKGNLSIDEAGTEAAAVSVALMESSVPWDQSNAVEFHANHPFVYIIYEKTTAAVLFIGVYNG